MRCNILNKIYKYLTRNSLKEFIEVFTNVYLLLEKCKKLDLFLKYGKLTNQSYNVHIHVCVLCVQLATLETRYNYLLCCPEAMTEFFYQAFTLTVLLNKGE